MLNFLLEISRSDSVLVEADTIANFCRGLRDFEDEIEEKMTKLETVVCQYINKANEVFYYNQEEIEAASESNRSGVLSDNESSKNEPDPNPHFSKSLNLQSLLLSNIKEAPVSVREPVDKSLPL